MSRDLPLKESVASLNILKNSRKGKRICERGDGNASFKWGGKILKWLHLIMKMHGLLFKPFKRRNRLCYAKRDDEITCLKVHRASVHMKIEKKLM